MKAHNNTGLSFYSSSGYPCANIIGFGKITDNDALRTACMDKFAILQIKTYVVRNTGLTDAG